jgi:hypothetical protein
MGKDHGQIPAGAFVAMRTDWSKRWPDAAKMENKDAHGVAHYPGWSLPALKYLYEDRKITASGHETTDTDPGSPRRRTITHSKLTFWARTIIRSSYSRISIKFRSTAQSLWSLFQNLKAAQDFLRGCLRFCPNLTHMLHDINRISCGFAR